VSRLTLDQITLTYEGHARPAVSGCTIEVASGEFVVLTGRSGCGKTTLLSVAAGLVAPTAGTVELDGVAVGAPAADRAMVFQDDALFPWLTVSENVGFALTLRRIPSDEKRRRVEALLERVHLAGMGERRIWELSGGMRQRVGLARALAAEPKFLLMDEPLGALDALTRERMQSLLLDIWTTSGAGVAMVTHGLDEALLLATRIVVMAPDPGRIVERFDVGFSRRVIAGESVSAIKSSLEFQHARADLVDAIFAGEAA
jgi:taurine transport system ATP-binding protein